MEKREIANHLRDQGYTLKQIAMLLDISRARAGQLVAQQGKFTAITDEHCPFVNLRSWMNKNRVSRAEFIRRMGYLNSPTTITRFSCILRGEHQPRKDFIDKMLDVTGMTYEELFEFG